MTTPADPSPPAPRATDRPRPSAIRDWLRHRPDHVVSVLGGGLGNQLFQFAAGRALSLRLRLPLKFDYTDTRDGWGRRGNELEAFRLAHPRLSDRERDLWLGPGSTPWTQRLLCRWVDRAFLRRRIMESGPANARRFRSQPRPAFLLGLWQSEDFFSDHADAIRAELLSSAPALPDSGLPAEISAPDSVAIHIRRGDYLRPEVVRTFGPCSPDYYARAVKLLRERLASPHFFLFTDDPDWVAAHPILSRLGTLVAPDHGQPAHDLALMSRCRHFVTANSTFSWWAAWLGQKPGALVITPDPWFDHPPATGLHIVPPRWLALPKN